MTAHLPAPLPPPLPHRQLQLSEEGVPAEGRQALVGRGRPQYGALLAGGRQDLNLPGSTRKTGRTERRVEGAQTDGYIE